MSYNSNNLSSIAETLAQKTGYPLEECLKNLESHHGDYDKTLRILLLRKIKENTNYSLKDCENALDQAGNVYDKAVEILQNNTESTAENKVDTLVNLTGYSPEECNKYLKAYEGDFEKARNILLLKKLRDITKCGIQDCKSALKDADNDFTKATEILRDKYKTSFAKRANMVTKEGCFGVFENDAFLSIVELMCETDFVANNTDFQKAANNIAEIIIENPYLAEDKTYFMQNLESINPDVSSSLTTFMENVRIARFRVFDKSLGPVFKYFHFSGSNKIAACVQFGPNFGLTLAKQIIASNPRTINSNEVTPEMLKEFPDMKPNDLALMTQRYLGDPKLIVGDMLSQIKPVDFVR